MTDLDQSNICFNRRTVLETKENSGAVRLPCSNNILGEAPRHDQVAVVEKSPVPVRKIGGRLPEVLVIADSHVHCIQRAFPHLRKDLSGPVTVLQAVDSRVYQCRFAIGHVITNRFQRAGSTSAPPRTL